MKGMRQGTLSFPGHNVRKQRLENIIVIGNIVGERGRGRPRLNYTRSFNQLLHVSEVVIIERNKKQGRVENRDCRCPNWIWHLKREREGETEREKEGEGGG